MKHEEKRVTTDETQELKITIHKEEAVDKPKRESPFRGPLEIIVDQAVWEQMNRHARETTHHEIGGLMLGEIYHHKHGLAVRITSAVAARKAETSQASLTFTLEAWQEMEAERKASNEKLLGWYHTHPGLTVFFSETDRFLQRSFFTQPWHVALVMDPVLGESAFYRWQGDAIERCPNYLLQVCDDFQPRKTLGDGLSQTVKQNDDTVSYSELESQLPGLLSRIMGQVANSPEGEMAKVLVDLIRDYADLYTGMKGEPEAGVKEVQRVISPEKKETIEDRGRGVTTKSPLISRGWLLENHLHCLKFRKLHSKNSRNQDLKTPFPIRDVAMDASGTIFLLSKTEGMGIIRISESLPHMQARYSEGTYRFSCEEVSLDWRNRKPFPFGRLIIGNKNMFLLGPNAIAIFHCHLNQLPNHFELMRVFESKDFLGTNLTKLNDWCVDVREHLYLLFTGRREVWRLDPISGVPVKPFISDICARAICVGTSQLNCYSTADSSMIQSYSLDTGEKEGEISLKQRLSQVNIFNDGDSDVYLSSREGVYLLHTHLAGAAN